jgi:hypothetical protein
MTVRAMVNGSIKGVDNNNNNDIDYGGSDCNNEGGGNSSDSINMTNEWGRNKEKSEC